MSPNGTPTSRQDSDDLPGVAVDPDSADGRSQVRWAFGSGELRLVHSPDRPVMLVRVEPSNSRAASDQDAAHAVPLVELALAGEGRTTASPNAQHRHYAASARLRFVHADERDEAGVALLTVVQQDPVSGVEVSSRFEHRPGATAFRATTSVTNSGEATVAVTFVSTLNFGGFIDAPISAAPARLMLSHARNAWLAEFRWHTTTLEQAGIVDIGPTPGPGNDSSFGHFAATGTGSWSTGDFLPVGAITDTTTGDSWAWQIEHNGAWQWQALDRVQRLYVGLSGPTGEDHQWSAPLAPGQTFTTVPAGVAVANGGLRQALAEMTRYRRLIRRFNADNRDCPVIFNDYMNCLMGDPTTERLLPLVAAAADAGAEYFVIDAGWYSDEPGWWDSVGEWQPSTTRFPGGLGEVTDAIRARGMVPGLWMEPEVVGVNSPLVQRLPDEAFFTRDGHRLTENGRHQLDLRQPAVTAHLDRTVDRLIDDFGVGYFKFDYNINIGVGTDVDAATPGAGLLAHNRSYSGWLDRLFARHPDLVIENCSSGGMRVDYAQLSRMSLQSTSDQTDPVRYVPIAASAPACVAPEQSAVWAYPQPGWSADHNDLTLVNALLGRVHLSGRPDLLDQAGTARIAEAIAVYKGIRHRIPAATGIWPIGLPGWYDEWVAAGLHDERGVLLQVWRRGGPASFEFPIPELTGSPDVRILFPATPRASVSWSPGGSRLQVELPDSPSAVLIDIRR